MEAIVVINAGLFATPLPLASGFENLFGILIFIIFAVVSAMGKRMGQPGEDEAPPKPVRRVPPQKPASPTPPPIPENPQGKMPEEMRRFLEDVQRRRNAPPPIPQREAGLPRQPAPPREVSPRRPLKRIEAPPVAFEPEPTPRPLVGAAVAVTIHEEVERSMQTLTEDVATTREELISTQGEPNVSESQSARPVFRFDPAMLRSPATLKQAVVWSEILGKPRGLIGLEHGPVR
ncbi:MAG: hypothetical protein HY360_16760 [Verrucomicrobia bacterium]|nr:hypothetical protein [Verrucomicrobiota bacterium]